MNKKSVGIITFYDGINYGAFFQAYSLYKVLETVFNLDTEFVNYKSCRHWFLENLVFYHKLYSLKYLRDNVVKIYKFKKLQRKLKKSRKILFRSQLVKNKYDYVFYGSDEIWNFKNPLVGYNTLYFGHNVDSIKISYAPSFGSVSSKTKLPAEVIKGLSSFKNISVRDKNSQKIIFNNLKRNVPIVLDPTLLIDKTLDPITPPIRDYVLVYTTSLDSQLVNSIKKFAAKREKKLVSIGYYYSWCDRSYVDIGSEEWLGFYKHADFVVTSMFHGTIYAIKNKKNFVSIITKYRKNKISNFLEDVGLEDRILSKSGNLERILKKKPNYKKIFRTIATKRKESLDFIKKSLE